MELVTLIGIVLGIGALLGAMTLYGIPFSVLVNEPAILLILLGTIAAVMNAFPLDDVKKVLRLFGVVFRSKKGVDKFRTIELFTEYAQIVRKDGILAVGKKLDEIENQFVKMGMKLLVSGVKSSEIHTVLKNDIAAMEKRHERFARIFSRAGVYATSLGLLGAALGFMAAAASMGDEERFAYSIAGAFIAIMYGIFIGYVILQPLSTKLMRKSDEELLHNEIVVAGVLALANGDPPYLVQHKLLSYLSQREKEKFAGTVTEHEQNHEQE